MNIKDYDKIRIKEILEIGSSFGCGLCSSTLKDYKNHICILFFYFISAIATRF